MTLRDFIHDVFSIAAASPICHIPMIRRISTTAVTIRVPVLGDQFIDAFCNEATGRFAYTLVKDERRIFGADNTGGWHLHPFDSPDRHEPLEQAMTFEEFVRSIEAKLTE